MRLTSLAVEAQTCGIAEAAEKYIRTCTGDSNRTVGQISDCQTFVADFALGATLLIMVQRLLWLIAIVV